MFNWYNWNIVLTFHMVYRTNIPEPHTQNALNGKSSVYFFFTEMAVPRHNKEPLHYTLIGRLYSVGQNVSFFRHRAIVQTMGNNWARWRIAHFKYMCMIFCCVILCVDSDSSPVYEIKLNQIERKKKHHGKNESVIVNDFDKESSAVERAVGFEHIALKGTPQQYIYICIFISTTTLHVIIKKNKHETKKSMK